MRFVAIELSEAMVGQEYDQTMCPLVEAVELDIRCQSCGWPALAEDGDS